MRNPNSIDHCSVMDSATVLAADPAKVTAKVTATNPVKVTATTTATTTATASAAALDPDVATTAILAKFAAPDGGIDALDAWKHLRAFNESMTTAPKAEIKRCLARQTAVLEAAALNYAYRASCEKSTKHAEALMRISLSCSRTLVAVLGATNTLANEEADAHAIEA